jgi:hypothetical protein
MYYITAPDILASKYKQKEKNPIGIDLTHEQEQGGMTFQ